MANRKRYNKLVRDRIPEIIRENGGDYEIETLSDEAFIHALRDKLIEEANEAALAHGDDLVKELADLSEVMDALLDAMSIAPITIQEKQQQRRLERGGFERKIQLIWSINPADQE